ncbi:MAG TPA: hypothetical protein VF240_08075, partial [Pyrinomonadaceae bacterium]
NAGAREMSDAKIGFQHGEGGGAGRGKGRGVIERTFSPEFRNRLDAWIAFDALSFETTERVVDKFIGELGAQLSAKNVSIELTDGARRWLATHGYDKQFGARPMSRLIQTEIKAPVAEQILFGSLQTGGTVRIEVRGEKLDLQFLNSQ